MRVSLGGILPQMQGGEGGGRMRSRRGLSRAREKMGERSHGVVLKWEMETGRIRKGEVESAGGDVCVCVCIGPLSHREKSA